MKKIIIFVLIAISATLNLQAEEFVIEQAFNDVLNDVSGTDPNNPKDANGVETAIIKVQCTMNDLVFVSDYIIGSQTYNHGQYVFFMAEGARFVEVRKKDGTILPATIKFADSGVKRVLRKHCYKMTISGKDVKYYGKLKINYGPTGAKLKINDRVYDGGYKYENSLEIGQYNILVEKFGFASFNQVIDLSRDTTITIDINLSQNQAQLSITTDELSDIYLDRVKVGKHKYDAFTSIGVHKIKIQHGTIEEEHEINVTASGATFNKELLGKLVDSYDKSNQSFAPGYDIITPRKGNNMEERTIQNQTTNSLLGDYNVTFNRPGYWSRSRKVHIEQVQTTTVYAPHLYKKKPWTFLSYQYSPKADVGMMLGICGKVGGYVSGRYNIGAPLLQRNFNPEAADNTFGVNCWTVDGGVMFRLCQELYLYAGAGYGTYESAGTKFQTSPHVQGATIEAGAIANIHSKSGKGFTITIGYNTLINQYYFKAMDPLSNIVAGIGFVL